MNRLTDKNIVITGATSGIGLATTKRFITEGARLLLVARRVDRLERLAAELGARATFVSADVGNEDDILRVQARAAEALGSVHGVFLNAGTAPFAPLGAVNATMFDNCMRTNVFGGIRLIAELAPLMPEKSAVLMTGSGMHHRPLPHAALWAASTFAVCGLCKALAVELAPRGIRVNVVSHGPVDTPIYDQYGMHEAAVSELKDSLARATLAQRLARPEEIAELAAFLLSDVCGFLSGTEVVCDGGWSLAPMRLEEPS